MINNSKTDPEAAFSESLRSEIENFSHISLKPTDTIIKNEPQIDDQVLPVTEEVKEYFSSDEKIIKAAKKFASLLKKSKHCVVYTGAGISTAANIPDYRGPNGVWTLRDQGKQPKMKISLSQALPTFSHLVINELIKRKYIKYIVSTNCDGLHRRSGVSEEHISELHGNIYREICIKCNCEHLRLFDVRPHQGKGFIQINRYTGRLCEKGGNNPCRGKLRDSIVNFGENLPERALKEAEKHSRKADLTLVLGSSMLVTPACELPSLSYEKGGIFCICNLQKIPRYDNICESSKGIRIFSKCDKFLEYVTKELDINVQPFQIEKDEIIQANIDSLINDDTLKKYNVHSMSDDGPPPQAILDQISTSSFKFRKHITVKEKHAKLEMGE